MVKRLFFAGMTAAIMTACSVEEGFDTPATPNEITFDVASTGTSRQLPVAADFDHFTISARHNESPFINEEMVSLNSGKWTSRSKTHTWPAEGDVDFFAYRYDETAARSVSPYLDVDRNGATLSMFSVSSNPAQQTPLQYATSLNRTANDGSVTLQFKEALSEIAFSAQNSSRRLRVEISEVSISHIYMTGTFTFPCGRQQASWDVSNSAPMTSKATFAAKTINNYEEGLGEETTMHLIPQSQDNATAESGYSDGACITFRCAVWKLAEGNEEEMMFIGERNADGSVTHGEFRVPVSINWKPGQRYTYSLNFGAGGSCGIPVAGGTMLPIAFSAYSEPLR